MPPLAQTANPDTLFQDVLPWAIALLAIVVAGGFVLALVRRRLRGGERGADGFTLHDLRRMHAAGELSDEEFERAKASLIGRLAAPAAPDASGEDDESAPR